MAPGEGSLTHWVNDVEKFGDAMRCGARAEYTYPAHVGGVLPRLRRIVRSNMAWALAIFIALFYWAFVTKTMSIEEEVLLKKKIPLAEKGKKYGPGLSTPSLSSWPC